MCLSHLFDHNLTNLKIEDVAFAKIDKNVQYSKKYHDPKKVNFPYLLNLKKYECLYH